MLPLGLFPPVREILENKFTIIIYIKKIGKEAPPGLISGVQRTPAPTLSKKGLFFFIYFFFVNDSSSAESFTQHFSLYFFFLLVFLFFFLLFF